MHFADFVADIEAYHWPVYAAEGYQDGTLIYSYGDTTHPYQVYSITKSILSIAVGMVWDRGLLDLDAPILSLLPEDAVSRMAESQRALFQSITVRRLLTMSVSGFPFRPEGANYLDFSLNCPIRPEKQVFQYSNISAYLVGVAVETILGRNLASVLEEQLFAPLHITDYTCGTSPEGHFYGASQMTLSCRDLSKVGLMLASGGVYDGRRYLSQAYLDLATSVQQANREGGYGFFFWREPGGYAMHGKWGQRCYCLPEKGQVITYLSHMEENGTFLQASVERNLLDL